VPGGSGDTVAAGLAKKIHIMLETYRYTNAGKGRFPSGAPLSAPPFQQFRSQLVFPRNFTGGRLVSNARGQRTARPKAAELEEKSVRDLTIEAVAKRAGVGKPTLYKWWPTKATLVLAMLCERMAPKLEKPTVLTSEQSLRFRVRSLLSPA
jgi:Bacterial regulatory proteins, tetR family